MPERPADLSGLDTVLQRWLELWAQSCMCKADSGQVGARKGFAGV